MHAKKRKAIFVMLALAICLAACITGIETVGSYPGPGSGYEGWTGERVVPGFSNPRHVQTDSGGGYLHLVADNGGDVKYFRAADEATLNWTFMRCMDLNQSRTARDPYIEASGNYVIISWKELVESHWALAMAVSADKGETWTKWCDANTTCNNYEAHPAFAGGKVHAVYVSDYDAGQGHRNEIYYRRFSTSLVPEAVSCASDNADWTAACYPCIEAPADYFACVYYQHGNAYPHPIYEAYTLNSGSSWTRMELIASEDGVDLSHPEVGVWVDGPDRRKMVVAAGDRADGYGVWYRRFANSTWDTQHMLLSKGTEHTYPQVATSGTSIMVVYRQSGESLNHGVAARINANSGADAWSHVEGLFFSNVSYNDCGSVDCCADSTRFYAASAGTVSPYNQVLTKREDNQNPTVLINDPGTYHNKDFNVTANASDDFNCSADWLLSPSSEHYDAGILHADFYYRKAGASSWTAWPGGARDADAPWSRSFPGATVSEGTYEFRVAVTDTAEHTAENALTGVVVDRTPPTGVKLNVSAPDGENGWYKSQPGTRPSITASDTVSGVKACYYKLDGAADWTVYSKPFDLQEGEHTISYYAEDNAGNTTAVKSFSYKADFGDPQGTITSPAGGEFVKDEISVSVDASDALSSVARVDFYFAGDLFASDDAAPFEKTCNISGYADGEREVQARVFDRAGRSAWTTKVGVKKDTAAPTVEITQPVGEEWISGMIACKANVTDPPPGEIERVEFYLDGEIFDTCTQAPWMGSLDTTRWGNDWHTIAARAWDKAGNVSAPGGRAQVEQFMGNNISQTNYFAEGCTRSGFDTYLCLQNPGGEEAQVTVNYMLAAGQGVAGARNYAVPPRSRMTVSVNSDVGEGKDVSIQVTSSSPIVSERPMYFDYSGLGGHSWKGGHTAQGVSVPGQEWYLAEGCTRPGFEEWLCILNPGDEAASVSVEYMLGTGQVMSKLYWIAPWRRYTISVNEEIGPGHDVSVKVTSDQDIVVERPMYFLYQGAWDGGHNAMAVPDASTEWFFAEGCTRAGFNQWLCILNPGSEPAAVDITYMTDDGTEIIKRATVAPRSRHTINANTDVAREHDVSTKLTSDQPIVVERPMYFWYGNMAFDEGSCAMGSNKACSTWYLAEGCTRAGFEEWICLQNPNDDAATVRLTYMLENSSCPEQVVRVAPHSRLTVRVNDCVGPDHDVSTEVQSDLPIIVERPIYSLYGGAWPAADSLNAYTFER